MIKTIQQPDIIMSEWKIFKGYWLTETKVKKGSLELKPDKDGKFNFNGTLMTIQEFVTGKPQERNDTITTEPIVHNDTLKTKKEKKKDNVTLRKAPKGKAHHKHEGIFIIAGKRYESAKQAHDATGLRINTLIQYCKLGCSFESA